MGQQAEMLKHHAGGVAPQFHQAGVVVAADVLTVDEDTAAGRLDQAQQAADEGGLAAAGKPHDDEELAPAHLQVDVPQGQHAARFFEDLLFVGEADLLLEQVFGVRTEHLPEALDGEDVPGFGGGVCVGQQCASLRFGLSFQEPLRRAGRDRLPCPAVPSKGVPGSISGPR